jgi:endonuclease III
VTIGDAMTETTLADAAIEWYDANARDLPWRVPGTGAWAVLVSEVMLQQTPVVRVTPAWHAWMNRWPTPADLAADAPAEAIRMWGRLGYPRRAMRLHACAVALVERHDGAVPSDLDALLALPGVGTYTARAVATFAYGQRHPVVDTNVRRVVSRAVDGAADAGPTTTTADLVATDRGSGLHGAFAPLPGLPAGGRVRLAGGRVAPGRGSEPATAEVRRHRPSGAWSAAVGAAGDHRAGAPATPRRGVGGRGAAGTGAGRAGH